MKKVKIIKKIVLKTAVFLTLVLLSTLVSAQTVDGTKNIEDLHFLKGKWSVNNYELKGKEWEPIGTTDAEFIIELNGKFISERVKYITKFGELNMITIIGFDGRLNNFKLSNMGADFGYMDIYFGKWIKDDLIFTNLKSDLPSMLDDGKELYFRLTYSEITSESFTHLVEGTIDNGETWFIFSKSVYSKKMNH